MHHLSNICDLHRYATKRSKQIRKQQPMLPAPLQAWLALINTFNYAAPHEDDILQKEHLNSIKKQYQATKNDVMSLAIAHDINMGMADTILQMVSLSRRFSKQVVRANLKFRTLELIIREDIISEATNETDSDDDDEADEQNDNQNSLSANPST
jgi:hypothetical protein